MAKLCPLLSIAQGDNVPCAEINCAWWKIKSGCAIPLIASGMSSADKVDWLEGSSALNASDNK